LTGNGLPVKRRVARHLTGNGLPVKRRAARHLTGNGLPLEVEVRRYVLLKREVLLLVVQVLPYPRARATARRNGARMLLRRTT
jgi:hypothetical protein